MSAFLGHESTTHFFLRVRLYCRDSCNLPECSERSLQASLCPRFLTSLCCLLHTGHPWRRKAELGCSRWEWHLYLRRRTQALSLEDITILEEAWDSCAQHFLLYDSFSTFWASWKWDQARKNMWCYSKLKPKMTLNWAKLRVLAVMDWAAHSFLWHLLSPPTLERQCQKGPQNRYESASEVPNLCIYSVHFCILLEVAGSRSSSSDDDGLCLQTHGNKVW